MTNSAHSAQATRRGAGCAGVSCRLSAAGRNAASSARRSGPASSMACRPCGPKIGAVARRSSVDERVAVRAARVQPLVSCRSPCLHAPTDAHTAHCACNSASCDPASTMRPLSIDDDAMRLTHRAQPVGDDDHGAALGRSRAMLRLQDRLALVVERAGGFVEDQDARVGEQRSRDRDALALAAAERLAPCSPTIVS